MNLPLNISPYGHVIDYAEGIEGFEIYMSGRMDSCLGEGFYSSMAPYNEAHKYELLQVSTNPLWVFPLEADKCVRIVAYDTRYDSTVVSGGLGAQNAEWMANKWPTFSIGTRHKLVNRVSWMSLSNSSDPNHDVYLFFQKIEESIDIGVHYLANAMTWVVREVRTYKCTQGVEDLKDIATNKISVGFMFMLLSYLSISVVEYFMSSSSSVWTIFLYA